MMASMMEEGQFNLPSHDALAQILPHYLQSDPQQEPSSSAKPNLHLTNLKRVPVCDCEGNPCAVCIPELQTQQMQNYSSAMRRMAADLISLQTQLVALQTENSQLRSQLAMHQDLGLDLLRDTDVDIMTKAEMADRIASLSVRLSSESSKAAAQTDRIQQLQNQLIRKNDSEKELLKLQSVSHQQQKDLQQQQLELRKMRELEATVGQQGKVIEKMERALRSKISVKNKQNGERGLVMRKGRGEATLAAEHTGLREELHRAPQPPTVVIQHLAQNKDTVSMRDRMALLAKLERTEATLQILEQQLEENSKLWGKQKQQMLIQLSENRHRLDQTSTTVLQK